MFYLLCICLHEDGCYVSVCCCDVSEFYSGVHRVTMTPCEGQHCALYMTQQWQTHNNTRHTVWATVHWHCMNGRHSPFNQSPNASLSVCACPSTHLSGFWNHYYTHVWFLESLLHTCLVSGNHYYALVLFMGIPTMSVYICTCPVCESLPQDLSCNHPIMLLGNGDHMT